MLRTDFTEVIPIKDPSALLLTLHPPATPAGADALARRVAALHAAGVIRLLRELPVPAAQKQAHLQSILSASKRNREQT